MSARDEQPGSLDFPTSQLFLRRLALSLVGDEARADDLVQDTWAAWLEHRPATLAAPRAWLTRVLKNRAFNELRAERHRAQREQQVARPESEEHDDLSGTRARGTDGTLEAQSRLLEALRKLDEPYRSTLVLRYYNDLSVAAIAEHTASPLNTVKARLARGLEKLRVELDRRYGGDRGAWCHWLLALGKPAATVLPHNAARAPLSSTTPALSSALPGSATGTAAMTTSLGAWIGLAALLIATVGWLVWNTSRPDRPSSPVSFERTPVEPAQLVEEAQRVPVRVTPPEESAPEAVVVAAPRAAPIAPPVDFDWPQFAGTREHDTFTAFKNRLDVIHRPREIWKHAGLSGQPTIRGTELYSGGDQLYRIDLLKNKLSVGGPQILERIRSVRGTPEFDEQAWRTRLARNGLGPMAWIAGAPALAGKLVLARLVGDGSVSAFDRDLTYEAWHWTPREPAPCPLSGCLSGDHFIVPHRHEVVCLSALNGKVEWRFALGAEGEVQMVPACDGDLVYFATDRGAVFAVDLARGRQTWRVETARAYLSYPLALGDRVAFLDDGEIGSTSSWRRAILHVFQSYDGRELWQHDAWPGANPGLDERQLFVSGGRALNGYALDGGSGLSMFDDPLANGLHAAPLRIAGELVTAEGNALFVRDLASKGVSWSYQLERTNTVLDFVHAGDRIYVVTGDGLVCLADDPGKEPAPPQFALGYAEEDQELPAKPRKR